MTEAAPDYFIPQPECSPAVRACLIDLCFLMRCIERAAADCQTAASEKAVMRTLMADVKRSHDALLALYFHAPEIPHE